MKRTAEIELLVANHFGVRLSFIRGNWQNPEIVWPRRVTMYLLRTHCGLSNPYIGNLYGRHQSTVSNAVAHVRKRMKRSDEFLREVLALEDQIQERRAA